MNMKARNAARRRLQREILTFIRSRGEQGATRAEIAAAVEVEETTASFRCEELISGRQIVERPGAAPSSAGWAPPVLVDWELATGTPPGFPEIPAQQEKHNQRRAAVAIKNKVRRQALRFIQSRGAEGATREEIVTALGTEETSTLRRCEELLARGDVVERPGPTPSSAGWAPPVLINPRVAAGK